MAMHKELIKEYPFTSSAFALVTALFVQGLFVGDDSVITNAMIQAGWCGVGNYICFLRYYSLLSFIAILLGIVVDLSRRLWTKPKQVASTVNAKTIAQSTKDSFNLAKLRLAEGLMEKSQDYNIKEYYLTLINESGQNIEERCVLLDEIAWKNLENAWEVHGKDIFDKPFRWNYYSIRIDGKITLDNESRASFAVISSRDHSIFNTTKNMSETETDFTLDFYNDEPVSIHYGPDIRLKLSIKGKKEDGKRIQSVIYFVYLHLLQPMGSPKVGLVKMERD